jgi:hypothetical protein
MMEEGQLLPPPVPPQGSHDTTEESDVSQPPDQYTSKDGSSARDPWPELTRNVAVLPLATTEGLVYDDIHGLQNKEVTRARRAHTPRAMVHCECY